MGRVILHSDINSAYASIECFHRPEIRHLPVAVGGDTEKRHGIVLAKNELAKRCGVKTGNAIWEAKQKCPDLQVLPPDFPLYMHYCGMVKEIYNNYTPQQESFGIDEAWLDCTGVGEGPVIAEEIRHRVQRELGITVSVGVSWNKIFAKLGSDYKKPDAVTVITRDNYRDVVWPLPASDLLYVGPATTKKLARYGIHTIGQLAQTDPEFLHRQLGKMGHVIYAFANGLDSAPVQQTGEGTPIKSIGNSTTTPKDMTCNEDVKIVYYALTESVSARLRENGFVCRGVQISIRDVELHSFERQCRLSRPTMLTEELHRAAMDLFRKNWRWSKPLRSIGIRSIDLLPANSYVQLSLFDDHARREKLEALEHTIDEARGRFGYNSIRRGITMTDEDFGGLDAKTDHTIHPVGYF